MRSVALVQFDIAWNDVTANLLRCEQLIQAAAPRAGTLIVLPEMFTTGFSIARGSCVEEISALTRQWMATTAQRYASIIMGSFADALDGNVDAPFNLCAAYGPGGLVAEYAKAHLFAFGGEGRGYRPGNREVTFTHQDCRITPFICYDLRFPIPFARRAMHTDLYAVLANWPESRAAHWRSLLIARAIENQAFVVGVNRIGEGGGLSYHGGSIVVSPTGEILHDLHRDERCLVVELDIAEVQRYRHDFPVLNDRGSLDA